MQDYNQMQALKRRMYAMRNGVVADTLRKGGSPFQIIFGVNLPQLAEIAADMPHTKEFATEVWHNTTTRESMLIATMLMPHADFTEADAMCWINEAPHSEIIDVLCLKLLRHLPFALALAQRLLDSPTPQHQYAGLRLMCNLAPTHTAEAIAASTTASPHTLWPPFCSPMKNRRDLPKMQETPKFSIRSYAAIVAVLIVLTMTVLDVTLVNVALPVMAAEFSISDSETVWIVTAYQLIITMLLLPVSAFGDRNSYRRCFLVGVAIFTLASALCAAAQSFSVIVAARVLQGVGAACVMGVNIALTRLIYPRSVLGADWP